MAKKSELIEKIRKRFKNEWLLIAIEEMDAATTTARRGRLVAHSPQRDEVYEKLLRWKGLALITHCQPGQLPSGYGTAL